MIKLLYLCNLKNYLYSLRFQISFVIVITVFLVGTISYVVSLKETRDNYHQLVQNQQKDIEGRASNATRVAVTKTDYIAAPREYSIIDDCKENLFPNRFVYNAYNVYEFNLLTAGNNPLLKKAQGLNWAFIVSVIISFITLLLAFDAISGEKEDRTMALVFSNSVPRGKFILSKFLSIVTIMFSITIIGIIVSLIILMVSSKVDVNSQFLVSTVGFLAVSLLFIAAMAIIGLMVSTLSKQSNISLLSCLTIWIFLVVVLPNSSLFFANKLFGIPKATEVAKRIKEERKDIFKNAPAGSGSARDGEPFFPPHELRANNINNIMNAEKRQKDAYYNQMFRQFERTRMLSIVSPIAQFEYMNEAVLDGGYLRFQKNWNDLHTFQSQFLTWFKDLDAKDNNSPHWYNPLEDLSTTRQAVSVEQIPVYTESKIAFAERVALMRNYLVAMILLISIAFSVCFVRFLRYDLR